MDTQGEKVIAQIEQTQARLAQDLETIRTAGKLKDEVIDSLKQANEILQNQLSARWGAFQILMAVLALLFTINFGYQVYKSADIRNVISRAESASDLLEKRVSELNLASKHQSHCLGQLTKGIGLTMSGFTDFGRQRHLQSQDKANSAIILLEAALQEASRSPQQTRGTAPQDTSVAIDLVSPLNDALVEVLFSAYTLSASTQFRLEQYPSVYTIGQRLSELGPKRWDGYHFMAIARSETEGNPYKDAIACYEKSLDYKPKSNLDAINLAELYFITEKFDSSRKWAEYYSKQDPDPTPIFKVLCTFFQVLSTYMMKADESFDIEKWKSISAFTSDLGDEHPKFDGYSSSTIKQFLKDIEDGAKLQKRSDKKKKNMMEGLEWLIQRAGE